MNDYRLLDEKTIRSNRMTPDEANAVVEMWAIRHRLREGEHGMPPIDPVAEGMTVPPKEAKTLLKQIRAQRQKPRTARPIAADVRLAMAAMAAFVLVVASIAGLIGSSNRGSYYPPSYYTSPAETWVTRDGFIALRNGNDYRDQNLKAQSLQPPRFVFGLDNTVYEKRGSSRVKATAEDLRTAIRQVIGGPLADSSSVSKAPITKEQIEAALHTQTGDPYADPSSQTGLREPLVEWKALKIAYGGKVTEATLPFARYSDKELRTAVAEAQDKIVKELTDAGLVLAVPPK
jgi:hypothetical protein